MHISVTCSATHWAGTQTIQQLFQNIQDAVGSDTPWICFWDCATIHTSAETRAMLAEHFPHCHLCFAPPGATSIPCDVVLFRSIKSSMRKAFCKAAATSILNMDSMGSLTSCHKHAFVGGRHAWHQREHESLEDVVGQAHSWHDRGVLFADDPTATGTAEDCQDDNFDDAEDNEIDDHEEEEKEEAAADPTAVASAPPPPTALGIPKFLVLRLIYGNPSTKELASAEPKPTASLEQPNPTASSSFESSSGA
eukprot:3846544-Amphidinium_carterae.3